MQEYMSLSGDLLLACPQLNWEEMAMVEPLSVAAHAVKERLAFRPVMRYWSWVVAPSDWPLWYLPTLPEPGSQPSTPIGIAFNWQKTIFLPGQPLMQSRWNQPRRKKPSFSSAFQVVFDATGNKQAMESGPYFAGHGGSFILVGLLQGSVVFPPPFYSRKGTELALQGRNADQVRFS